MTLISTFLICVYNKPPWLYQDVEFELSSVIIEFRENRPVVNTDGYMGKLEHGWVYPIYRGGEAVCE